MLSASPRTNLDRAADGSSDDQADEPITGPRGRHGRRGPMARVALRGIRAHKVRLVSTMVAVLLGVSFMCGTAILGDTVRTSFDEIFVDAYARIDVLARHERTLGRGFGARRERIDGTLADRLREVPGVAAAEGQVEAPLRVLDRTGRPMYNPQANQQTFGLNWLTTPQLNGWSLVEGRPPADGEVVVDRRTATDGGYRVGDPVRIAVASGVVERRLAGIATFAGLDTYSGSAAVLLTTPDAQQLVGEPGRVDWISLVATPGTERPELADRVRSLGLPETQVLTGDQYTQERQTFFAELIELFTQVLSAFGLLALFVGVFIIYNTFAIIVAQRSRELALLRAVGASRKQIVGSVLTEATAVGVIASAIGVVAGIGVAHLLRFLIERFGFELPDTPLVFVASRAVLPVALGITVTVIAALLPAWRAARIPPVAAMREYAVDHARHAVIRAVASVPMFLAAGGLLWLAMQLDSENAVGVALLAGVPAVVGLAIVGPVIAPPVAHAVGAVFPPVTGITGRLAQRNAVRNPTRTSSTACALVIGVSLVVTITVLASSLSATVERNVDKTIAGDFVVLGEGFLGISPAIARDLAALDEVREATGVRAGQVSVRERSEFAIAVDPTAIGNILDLDVVEGSLDRLGPGTVAIASSQARRDGVKLGDRIAVRFLTAESEPKDVEVAVIYDRALTRNGEYLFSHDGWDPNVPESARIDQRVLVTLEAGVTVEQARPALARIVETSPTAVLLDVDEYRDRQVGQVSQRISYLYALLGLAVLVGVLGIVNTLLLAVHERRREIGLLRAVGSRRRQVSASVLQEAVLVAVPGAVFGVALGLVLGWAVVQTVRFDEAIEFAVPGWWLVAITGGACVAGLLAGLYPAWRAGRVRLGDLLSVE